MDIKDTELQQKMLEKFLVGVFNLEYIDRTLHILNKITSSGHSHEIIIDTKGMGERLLEHSISECVSLGSFITDNFFEGFNNEDKEVFLTSSQTLAKITTNLDTKDKSDVSYPQTNQQVH
jgi:hypothetical protein